MVPLVLFLYIVLSIPWNTVPRHKSSCSLPISPATPISVYWKCTVAHNSLLLLINVASRDTKLVCSPACHHLAREQERESVVSWGTTGLVLKAVWLIHSRPVFLPNRATLNSSLIVYNYQALMEAVFRVWLLEWVRICEQSKVIHVYYTQDYKLAEYWLYPGISSMWPGPWLLVFMLRNGFSADVP